jgi:hypothetical protein
MGWTSLVFSKKFQTWSKLQEFISLHLAYSTIFEHIVDHCGQVLEAILTNIDMKGIVNLA